jgi:hypothetical protein
MKKFILISVIVLLVALISIYVSLNRPHTDIRLIKLKGVSAANFSKGYFNIISGLNKDSLSAIPASENDLLYVMDEVGDFEFFYQPLKEDGDFLKFRTDSFGIFLGGKLISLELSLDNGSLEWLENSTREQISFLRSLVIADSLTENCLPGIKRIAESGTHPGMLISKDQKIIPELISLIKPAWIYTGDNGPDSSAMNAIYETKNLELLALEKVKINFVSLSGLPKLKSLILSGPDSATVSQLDRLPERISSLQIIDSKLKDLHFLKPNSKLKELNLISSDLQNIESLRNCSGLEVLSLIDCDSVPDLSPLSALHHLKWLAPPWNINAQDLETIIRNSPEIETLVLYDCKYLKSLAALKRLPKLSNLSLVGTSIKPDSLIQFQRLKYLSFHSDQKTDSLNVIKLQSMMPGTLVVPAEPFCMGSGWLLVFFLLLMTGCSVYVGLKRRSLK